MLVLSATLAEHSTIIFDYNGQLSVADPDYQWQTPFIFDYKA